METELFCADGQREKHETGSEQSLFADVLRKHPKTLASVLGVTAGIR